MARLNKQLWEQARAEYEVRGISLSRVAEMFSVDRAAVSRRAKSEGWEQGKSHTIVEKKVAALKALSEVAAESHALPVTFRHTVDTVVQERLQAEGLFAQFDQALLHRALQILPSVDTPEKWATMTQGRRNLAPVREQPQTTVNVSQQQAQAVLPSPQPQEALRQALRGAFTGDDD